MDEALKRRAEQAERLASDRLAQMQADRKQAIVWRDAATATERVTKHRSAIPVKRWELSPPPHPDDRPAIKAYAAKLARKRAKLAGADAG